MLPVSGRVARPVSGRVSSRAPLPPPPPPRRRTRSVRFESRPRPQRGNSSASTGDVSVRPGVPVVTTVPIAVTPTQRRRGGRVRVTRSRSRAASSPAVETPPPQRRHRPAVNYFDGDSEGDSSSDPEDVAIGDGVQFVLLSSADGTPRLGGTEFVSLDVVPPQDRDMSSECGGRWCMSAPGEWRLVDDLGEMELLTVQMRLEEMEHRPSPVQQQQQQQQQVPLPPPRKRQRSSSGGSDAQRTLGTCRVCMDAVVQVVFRNCGHLCICNNCRAELVYHSPTGIWIKCPVCRTDGDTIEVFV